MKKNIAVVGAGYWGKNLIRNFHELGVLKTVCDRNTDLLTKANFPWEAIATWALDVVMNDSEIEGVVIATPAETHYELASEVLKSGKDVFIEKPMALSSRDGKNLVKMAENRGRIILVGHVLEYHPAVRKLYEMVHHGKLGTLRYIYSNRLNLGKFRTEENILWSFAPHDVAVMLSLTGSMPTDVVAQGATYINSGVADVTITGLTFPNNIKGHIFVSWLHPYKEQRLVVIGDKGMAVFNDMEKDKLVFYNKRVAWEEDIPLPETGKTEVIKFTLDEPLKLECLDFLRAMKDRRPPLVDGKKGVQVLEVLEMCQSNIKEVNR